MRLVPFHQQTHGPLIETWAPLVPQVFIEQPDQSKPQITMLAVLDGRPVGWVQAFNIERREAQVGIAFPEPAGKRIVVPAAMKFARFLFDTLDLGRLRARVLAGNEAPGRLLAFLGFRQVAVDEGAVFADGSYRDVIVYVLDRADFEQRGSR